MSTYAVIGNPVKHSLSPQIHQYFAQQAGIVLEYRKIAPEPDDFLQAIKQFFAEGGKGCNITVPFKMRALSIADKISDEAQIAQAANCLTWLAPDQLRADNFDGTGLTQDLSRNHQYSPEKRNVLIVGAGGATRGILASLLEKQPECVVIANRTVAAADAIAAAFQDQGKVIATTLHGIPEQVFDLVIHATSLGYQGKIPDLPENIIDSNTFCYDLSYGEAATPFLTWGRHFGAKRVTDGFGMLLEQAAATFYLWHGIYPDTADYPRREQNSYAA